MLVAFALAKKLNNHAPMQYYFENVLAYLATAISYAHKMFIRFNVIKLLIQPYFANVHTKLDCLSLASRSSLVECLQVRPEPTHAKHLSGALP